MHTLYELKDMLCEELEEFGKKGELTAGSLETVDKLAHAIKNLDKIIEAKEEEEYSNAMNGGGSYEGSYARRGGSYARGSYARGGRSYARGRGSNAKRDSMGRYASDGYSRNEEMIAELHELMNDAQDERTKQEFQRFIQKIEMM